MFFKKLGVIKLFKEKFLSVGDLKICYVEEGGPRAKEISMQGKGKNIIFIHGWQGSSKTWRYNLDYFAKKGYQVFALDLPGSGKSSKPKINYSTKFFSEVIKKIIEKKEMEKVIFVCHSAGTFIGIDLALSLPGKIERLVLVGPPGNFGIFPKILMSLMFSKSLIRFYAIFKSLVLKATLTTKTFFSKSQNDFERTRKLIELNLSFLHHESSYIHALNTWAADIRKGSIEKILAKINQPTLIIRGEKEFFDLFASPRNVRFLLSNIKNANLVTLKKCGHLTMTENPDLFNKEVYNFLKAGK